jgi:hypothetical protein
MIWKPFTWRAYQNDTRVEIEDNQLDDGTHEFIVMCWYKNKFICERDFTSITGAKRAGKEYLELDWSETT